MITIKENKNLNKLINLSSKILRLIYILLIFGIVLFSIFIIKELKILLIIKSICCVLLPLFIGFIIAWLFNPLVKKMNNKGIPKVIAALIIYFIIIFFIFVFFKIFIPVLYKQINDLINILPIVINKVTKVFNDITARFYKNGLDISSIRDSVFNCMNKSTVKITTSMPKYLINMMFSFIGCLGIISVGLVVGIYMLIDFDNVKDKFIKLIPKKYRNDITSLIDKISIEVRKTVNGTLLVSLMVLVCDTIAFSAIGLESPLLFGVLCGLTDLIPYIGPYIGGTAATVIGFTEGTGVGIAVLIACVIVQLVENYIFQPVVMSKSTKLHPVVIIIGLLLFGHFFGIIGMIVASPVLAILKVIYEYIIKKIEH